MSFRFINGQVNSSGAISLPANDPGDIAFALIWNNSTGVPNTPSGWTSLSSATHSGGGCRLAMRLTDGSTSGSSVLNNGWMTAIFRTDADTKIISQQRAMSVGNYNVTDQTILSTGSAGIPNMTSVIMTMKTDTNPVTIDRFQSVVSVVNGSNRFSVFVAENDGDSTVIPGSHKFGAIGRANLVDNSTTMTDWFQFF